MILFWAFEMIWTLGNPWLGTINLEHRSLSKILHQCIESLFHWIFDLQDIHLDTPEMWSWRFCHLNMQYKCYWQKVALRYHRIVSFFQDKSLKCLDWLSKVDLALLKWRIWSLGLKQRWLEGISFVLGRIIRFICSSNMFLLMDCNKVWMVDIIYQQMWHFLWLDFKRLRFHLKLFYLYRYLPHGSQQCSFNEDWNHSVSREQVQK